MTAAAPVTAWWDQPADGVTNMAADLALAAEAERRRGLVIRCYAWAAPTVSLGAFQAFATCAERPDLAGLAVVRRPSGGGAIVHGTDLTYAAAVPRDHVWAAPPQALYDALHEALVAALADRGVVARLHGGDGRAAAAEPDQPFLCFDRRSPGDVVAAPAGRPPAATDSKIMGSAQRRLAHAILQHGSLLVRANPAVRGDARHAGIAELHGEAAAERPRDLAVAWVDRLARRLGEACIWREDFPGGVDPAELESAAGRFRDPRWLRRL